MMEMGTLYGCLQKQVKEQPDATAVFDEYRRLTFRELDALATNIAATFPAHPKFVGVVMNHSVEMIASLFAILKTGAAYIPVEPSFPIERIHFIMDECKVDFILTEHEYARKLGATHPLLFIERGTPINTSASVPISAIPEDVAYILYTSGSTGSPKGVMVENRNVCHYVRAFRNEFHPKAGDVMLQYSVCSFDIFVEEVFASLLSGAALAIPPYDVKNDIHRLMHFVDKHNVTIISGFPYLLLEMNKLEHIPSSLRLLISGGDVLRAGYVNRLLPQADVYNTYGPSETTVCASYYRCNGTQALPDGTYPIGKAVKGVSIEILDENMRPVPLGKPGEICVFGDGVSRGYVNNRKENEAFVTLEDGRRMYHSGDLGIMQPDGNLLFLYRKDTQVMILGRRVEPLEVQNILCECPEVEKGVVCANVDEQQLAYLTAYIVPKNKQTFRVSAVRKTMEKFLPSYMIPEFFVRMDAMPITPNGKVNHIALPVVLKTGDL